MVEKGYRIIGTNEKGRSSPTPQARPQDPAAKWPDLGGWHFDAYILPFVVLKCGIVAWFNYTLEV